MSIKQVVHYNAKLDVVNLVMGQRAFLYPLDHPDGARVSNQKMVITSPVVRVGEKGEFETANTVYIPQGN